MKRMLYNITVEYHDGSIHEETGYPADSVAEVLDSPLVRNLLYFGRLNVVGIKIEENDPR